MKVKNVNLEYYVFYMDFNTRKLVRFNILDGMSELIAKNIRTSVNSYNHISDRATLKSFLEREFMYHYWSKCEYEVGVLNLFAKDIKESIKIDVWYQIEPNLDLITDYIIIKMKLNY